MITSVLLALSLCYDHQFQSFVISAWWVALNTHEPCAPLPWRRTPSEVQIRTEGNSKWFIVAVFEAMQEHRMVKMAVPEETMPYSLSRIEITFVLLLLQTPLMVPLLETSMQEETVRLQRAHLFRYQHKYIPYRS